MGIKCEFICDGCGKRTVSLCGEWRCAAAWGHDGTSCNGPGLNACSLQCAHVVTQQQLEKITRLIDQAREAARATERDKT